MDVKFLGMLLLVRLTMVESLDVIKCSEGNENTVDGCCDGVSNCQQTRLCQAVVGMGLVVECSVCPPGDNVTWTPSPVAMPTLKNRTIFLNDQQTMRAKGCFTCTCGQDSTHLTMSFNVTVENGVKPNVTVHPDSIVENNYTLPSLMSGLNLTHGDRVCLDMSTTGYPTPMYTWLYHNASNMDYMDISTNPCFSQPSYGMLCVLPTRSQLLNTGEGLDLQFRANVTNVAGYITLFQRSHTDVSDSWYIKAHANQSSGSISLNDDGVGTAWCAAYSELNTTLNFSVCIMNDSYTLGEQACLFVSEQLKCYPCGYTSQSLNLTAEMATNQLGFKVALCEVSSSTTGEFVCIASRKQSFGPQVIGSFTFIDKKTFIFWKAWRFGSVIGGGGLGIILIILIIAVVTVRVTFKAYRRHQRRSVNLYQRLSSQETPIIPADDPKELESCRRPSGGDLLKTFPPGHTKSGDDFSSNLANSIDKQRPTPPSTDVSQQGSPSKLRTDSPGHETALERECWIPFGIQSHTMGSEGGDILLDTECDEDLEAIKIEVPKDAVNVPTLKIRSAVIVHGPFSVPDGHKLASMVVYVYFDPRYVSKPLLLHLPNWVAKSESTTRVVIASHSLTSRQSSYDFKFADSALHKSGVILIEGHSSLFAKAIGEAATNSYYLIPYHSMEAGRNKVDVFVTYRSATWLQIIAEHSLGQFSNGKQMARPVTFQFKDNDDHDSISLRWEQERGPGWKAVVCDTNKVFCKDVSISEYRGGIWKKKQKKSKLEEAVKTGIYPPGIGCEISFRESLKETGDPHYLPLRVFGGVLDEKRRTFQCGCYQEKETEKPSGERGNGPLPDIGPVMKRVKEMAQELVEGLNIDDVLLAAMYQESLLTNVHRQSIYSMLETGGPPIDRASYFVNKVLFNYPCDVFEEQLAKLEVILADHADVANRDFAKKMCKIRKECQSTTV